MERLRSVIRKAHTVLDDAPELNMYNYDRDEVRELNDAANEAFMILNSVSEETEKR